MKIGLQTFTVRRLMRTSKNIDKTFLALAEMGIENLEIAVDYLNFPFTESTARMLDETARRNGLKIASCQIKYKTASADPAKTAEWMRQLGAKTVVNSVIDVNLFMGGTGFISGQSAMGQDGILRYCEQLNELAAQLKPYGIDLAHHNHHYEFMRCDYTLNGGIVLDLMIKRFEGGFVFDTYWCQKGGGNVIELLGRLKGRVPVMHLHDFVVDPFGLLTGGKDAAVGEGAIPFGAVLNAAEAAGVEYGMIEQKTRRPLECVGKSVKTLNQLR